MVQLLMMQAAQQHPNLPRGMDWSQYFAAMLQNAATQKGLIIVGFLRGGWAKIRLETRVCHFKNGGLGVKLGSNGVKMGSNRVKLTEN